MGEIQNNITNATQVLFQLCTEKTKLGTPAAGTIVFIQDTKELYLDGIYYGLSTEDARKLSDAVQGVGVLKNSYESLANAVMPLSRCVTNLRKFADSGDVNDSTGPTFKTYSSGVLKDKKNVKAAIDALANAVDKLNNKQWISKGTGKFVISVGPGADGAIEVRTAEVKSTDVKRTAEQQASIAGETVEAALETLKGKAAAAQTKADANATAIGVINGTDEGSISKAVSDAKSELIGTGEGVWAEGELKTLTKLRELITANATKISTLQGVDNETAAKLTAIVNELKTAGENGDFAGTLLDKFLTLYGTPTDGQYDVNGGKQTTLQGIISAIETRITNVNNTLSNSLTSTIQGLDATKRGQLTEADEVEDTKHVGVKVVETDGKLTEVKVVEKDIASAQALSNLTTTVNGINDKVTSQGNQLTWTVIS